MGDDWPTSTLGGVAHITTGNLDSNEAVPGGGYPFFTCSPETLQIDKYAFDCEAILLAGNNASGDFSVKYYQGRFNAYQRTYVITVRDRAQLDTRFLYYHITQLIHLLRDYSLGTATKFLTMKILDPLPVSVPPLTEQRAIARVLGTMDERVDNTRRLHRTLGAIADTVFRSWFVDFHPVHAKTTGRWVKGESLPGLPASMWDLFPSSFQRSGIEIVPTGWGPVRLGEYLTPSNARVGGEDLEPYSVGRGGVFPRRLIYRKSLAASLASNKRIVRGNLVFGLGGGSLVFGLMRDAAGAVSPAYDVFMVSQEAVYPDHVERYIRANMGRFAHLLRPGARVGQSVDKEGLFASLMPLPPKQLQDSYQGIIQRIVSLMGSRDEESFTLTVLRDALLPKLISGELRIGNAKRFLKTFV